MSTKHKPEPWTVAESGIDVNEGAAPVLVVDDYQLKSIDHEILEMRARLIAAAPEMLEALELVAAEILRAGSKFTPKQQKAVADALNKAKARGES